MRERLLQAAAPFYGDWVSQQRAAIETLRQTTAEFADDERLAARVEYEAEYRKVEAKAQTAAYQETRRTHPKIERKLGELARHHQARRARFRGLPKVLVQAVLTALVVNVKRLVKLLAPTTSAAGSACAVRADLGVTRGTAS